MTVAFDAELEFATFTTTTPATGSFTPVGTPAGIVVDICHRITATDLITSVSYGGVAMTRFSRVVSASGTLVAYKYFLGSGIPTGTQTVSIVHDGNATPKWFICRSVTAAANTEIVTSGTLTATQADPQIVLNTGATEALRMSIIMSGHSAIGDLAVLSGMVANSTTTSHDFGTELAIAGRQTTASTGSFTIGYTATSDNQAMIAVAIQEIPGAYVADRATSSETSVVTTHTVTLPTDIALNDYILIAAAIIAVTGVTGPTGYTELVNTSDVGLGEYRIWYKLADGSETTTTFTTGATAVSAHLSWSIRNASVPEVAGANGTSAAPDPPSLSPAGGSATYLWLAVEGFGGAVTQTAGPASYVQVRTVSLAGVGGIGGAENTTTAASENPGAFTLSGSGVWRASTLDFPVAVAAAVVTFPYIGGGYYPN